MADANSLAGIVFSGLSALVVMDVAEDGDAVLVSAWTRGGPVPCPTCGTPTEKVHGFHTRTLADVPVDGRRVKVSVRLRRLVCPVLGCPRQTFREQVPGTVERHQRRTNRLAAQLGAVVKELAGRAGARISRVLAFPVSRSSALRALTALPVPAVRVPQVIGIDDFALKRLILSRPKGVLAVVHGSVSPGVLPGGRGYLRLSSTRGSGREHAGSACRVADDAAGIMDGFG